MNLLTTSNAHLPINDFQTIADELVTALATLLAPAIDKMEICAQQKMLDDLAGIRDACGRPCVSVFWR